MSTTPTQLPDPHPADVDARLPAAHIPNLLHLLLLLLITGVCLISIGGLVAAITGKLDLNSISSQRNLLFIEGLAYLAALAVSWFIFPLFWRRSFLTGIGWNARAVSPLLVGFGLLLGLAAQAVEVFLPHPRDTPMDRFVQSDQLIWPLVILGVLLAPLFEEIVFRGFLLPACATAVQWLLTVLGHSDGFALWQPTTPASTIALVISSLITSALFGALHGPQLGASIPAMLVLATVSLILCTVRLRTKSVAAATLVHASYNLSLFVTLFVATGGFRHLDRLK